MSKSFKTAFVLSVLMCAFLHTPLSSAEETPPASSTSGNVKESWYWGFGLGWARPNYSGDARSTLDAMKSLPGYESNGAGVVDVGFWWPLESHQTALGVSLNGISDSYDVMGAHLYVEQNMIAFSVLHYFGDGIGDGFFLRGDLGPSRYRVDITGLGAGGVRAYAVSEAGAAILLGGGYSILLSDETRMPFGFYVIHNSADGHKTTTPTIRVSVLF